VVRRHRCKSATFCVKKRGLPGDPGRIFTTSRCRPYCLRKCKASIVMKSGAVMAHGKPMKSIV
jgi:hypothetical protein